MKLLFVLVFVLLNNACDRVSYELNKVSKEIEAEEAHLKKVADGTRIFDGDPEPKWPGEEGDKTLEGIDSDNDGLRDDVEIWINEYVKEPVLNHDGNMRQAVKQYARDQIKFMLGYNKSKEEVIKLHDERMRSGECVNFFWFLIPENDDDKYKYQDLVNPKIISTYEREKAHTRSSDILGSFYYGPDGDLGTRAKHCKLKVDYLQNYIDIYAKDDPKLYKHLKAKDLQCEYYCQ